MNSALEKVTVVVAPGTRVLDWKDDDSVLETVAATPRRNHLE
jgi:hypothetical protein